MGIFDKNEIEEKELLSESFNILPDNTYRKTTKFIIISCLRTIVQKSLVINPNALNGGISELTYEYITRMLIRSPRKALEHRLQIPYHFYTEWLGRDYGTFIGCPSSNRSWVLDDFVDLNALDIKYRDSFLIVLQEDYSKEIIENRLWKHLAHNVITPLLRELGTDNRGVVFLEDILDETVTSQIGFPYDVRKPTFLEANKLILQLKYYGKR